MKKYYEREDSRPGPKRKTLVFAGSKKTKVLRELQRREVGEF